MKKLYKALLFTALVAALALSVALIGGCNEDTEPTGPVSSLRGTFTYNATLGGTSEQPLKLTTDPAALTDGSFRLYCGQGAPFTNASGTNESGINFAYQINQNLVLARDFTYVYTYSIVIKNPAAWGGTYGKTETTVSGTFEFTAGGDADEYEVKLSAPTGGTQEFFGIVAGDPNNAYNGWSPSTEPTYAQNFDYADSSTAMTIRLSATSRRKAANLRANARLPWIKRITPFRTTCSMRDSSTSSRFTANIKSGLPRSASGGAPSWRQRTH